MQMMPPKHYRNKPTGLRVIFRSLQYRNFRLFFGGQSISLIGTWIQQIATPWLVYHLTGSVFLLGVVGFAGQIPTFLISPFAGVMTDRWNRYHILITTQILSMIQALLMALLFFTGVIKIWQIILLSLLLGCINACDTPARQSFFIEMVEKKKYLANAIALNSSMVNAARLLGPSIAGMLIAFTNEGICFLINGISYIFVIGSLLSMKIVPRKMINKDTRLLQELKEGFSYVFDFAPVKYIILMLGLVSLMGMPFSVLMPVFAKVIFHGGSHTFGFLMGASGIGALSAALYLASRKNVLGLFKRIPMAAGIFGLGLIAFSFSRFYLFSLLLMIVTGFGMMFQLASSNTILQTIVDDDKRGRVMSFYTMAFMGTAPFGSLLAGGLAHIIGAPYTILIGGISIILGASIFAYKLPELRKMIRLVYAKLGIITPELL
ncbi:MAG: MFS transporter [Smithella sp.]